MMHYFLIFIKYVLPGLVIAGFTVRFLWGRLFSRKQ